MGRRDRRTQTFGPYRPDLGALNEQVAADAPFPLGLLRTGPTVVGATGGSGTRVVARIVRDAGLFIGTSLNESEDALPFGAYSDRWINAYIPHRSGRLPAPLAHEMLDDLWATLHDHCAPLEAAPRAWGWKEPRSIYLLPFLHSSLPSLRFVHVVRDGRDMAFSANQNQLGRHGDAVGVPQDLPIPLRSISLWAWINTQTTLYAARHLAERYFRVRFEDLCARPEECTSEIFDFLGLRADAAIALRHVSAPRSLGRWRNEDPLVVARLEQLAGEALEALGYELTSR